LLLSETLSYVQDTHVIIARRNIPEHPGTGVDSDTQQQPKDAARDLKIMIVSTPKTGNTWLRHLLATIYDLPTVQLGFPFGPESASALGQRWILHQHYTPEPVLLDWAKQNGAVLITTIRHPGDILLSLYHHVHSYNERFDFYRLAQLADDDGTFGAPVRSVLQTIFKDLVALSVAWLSTGASHVVQYEALHYDPVDTVTALAHAIQPVSRDCIERAIESCHISEMRALAQNNRAFFRQGSYGSWRHVLPPDIIDLLRTTEPYPALFAALGYTLDAQDKWSAASAKRLPAKADFFEHFGHSPAATALLKSIYLSFDSADAQRRWPNIANASMPTSFHVWLNQPADSDPYVPAAAPLITNIAAHIHRMRIFLRVDFPDLYGQDRADFVFWFLEHAAHAYQLDDVYVAPMRRAFNEWVTTAWAIEPDTHDPIYHQAGDAIAGVPVLTYLAKYIYRRRPDLRAAFPNLYGQHRIDFIRWLIAHAAQEYNLNPSCATPLRLAFTQWATQLDTDDSASHASVPILTNLATYLYQRQPDLRAAFPDLYGQHRIDFIRWLIAHAAQEYNIDDACVEPLRLGFFDWATRVDLNDPAAHTGDDADTCASVPILTNLATYLYQRRPDLRAAFPDLYDLHRIDLVRWVVEHAAHEHGIDPACVEPLRLAFTQWATRPDANDPLVYPNRRAEDQNGVPVVTNLAAYIYRSRPDLRTAFPNVYGRQRIGFLLWLIEHVSQEYQIDDSCIAPLRHQFLDWALHSRSRQSHDRYDIYRFVYLSQFLIAHKQLPTTPIGTMFRSASRLLLGR
jgi:hypothetical protein